MQRQGTWYADSLTGGQGEVIPLSAGQVVGVPIVDHRGRVKHATAIPDAAGKCGYPLGGSRIGPLPFGHDRGQGVLVAVVAKVLVGPVGQSSFKIVPIPRLLVNSPLLLSPDKSR